MSETPPAAGQSELTGQMFMYEKPELLTRERHSRLGVIRPDQPFKFCAAARAVPVTLNELATCARHYPIVFVGDSQPMPIAVLGVIDDVNLFVGEDGEWAQDAYIPGYIRRYPFALAGDEGTDRLAMVVDVAFNGISENPETPFFDGDAPSDAMKQAVDFCREYEQARLVTIEFSKALKELDLIVSQVANYTPTGATEPVSFAQYFAVDEQKLRDLSDEKFLELRKKNLLPFIYAHLTSMGNWRAMLERRARRFNLEGDAVLQPRSVN